MLCPQALLYTASSAASLPRARLSMAAGPRAPLLPQLAQQRVARHVAARAEEAESSSAAAAEEPLAAEQLLSRKRKPSKAAAQGKPSSLKMQAGGPTVIAPVRDQVYGGGPQTPVQKAENTVVATLAVLFFVILAEGVFLAASGFLPESLDQFAQDVVFPAFSPTLGVFLAISTAYGVWKTRSAPEGKQ